MYKGHNLDCQSINYLPNMNLIPQQPPSDSGDHNYICYRDIQITDDPDPWDVFIHLEDCSSDHPAIVIENRDDSEVRCAFMIDGWKFMVPNNDSWKKSYMKQKIKFDHEINNSLSNDFDLFVLENGLGTKRISRLQKNNSLFIDVYYPPSIVRFVQDNAQLVEKELFLDNTSQYVFDNEEFTVTNFSLPIFCEEYKGPFKFPFDYNMVDPDKSYVLLLEKIYKIYLKHSGFSNNDKSSFETFAENGPYTVIKC